MPPRLSRLLLAAVLAVLAGAGARAGEGGEIASCLYAPAPPAQLVAKDAITDYQSVLRTCRSADGRPGLAIRTMTVAGTPILLLADPQKLSTRLERAACWTCQDASEDSLGQTRMMRAVAQSAAWRCAKRSRQSGRVRAEYRPTGLEK